MCELLGVSSEAPADVREYLNVFYSHSARHPNGWGLMRENNGRTEIIKEPVCALQSSVIDEIVRETEPQTLMLAHIRLATVGTVKYDNCHPYTGFDASGRRWTLIHNGTIYSGTELMKYLSVQSGDTDSERIFLYLLDEINSAIIQNGAPLSIAQRCEIADKLAVMLSPRNKLNFMISDGELLYVHKNMSDTLSYKKSENGLIFATSPLDNEDWQPFPMTQMHAFKDGKRVFAGTNHKHKFIPTLEYITALDAMNI